MRTILIFGCMILAAQLHAQCPIFSTVEQWDANDDLTCVELAQPPATIAPFAETSSVEAQEIERVPVNLLPVRNRWRPHRKFRNALANTAEVAIITVGVVFVWIPARILVP